MPGQRQARRTAAVGDPCHGMDMSEGLWPTGDSSSGRNTLRDSGPWIMHAGAETSLKHCGPYANLAGVGRSLQDHDLRVIHAGERTIVHA